jgi:hypothetical protein
MEMEEGIWPKTRSHICTCQQRTQSIADGMVGAFDQSILSLNNTQILALLWSSPP